MRKIANILGFLTATILVFVPIALAGLGMEAVATFFGCGIYGIGFGFFGAALTVISQCAILKAGVFCANRDRELGFLKLLKR